jgi:hypothetical protein
MLSVTKEEHHKFITENRKMTTQEQFDLETKHQDGFEAECQAMMNERGLDWESAVRFVLDSYDGDFLRSMVGEPYLTTIKMLYEGENR